MSSIMSTSFKDHAKQCACTCPTSVNRATCPCRPKPMKNQYRTITHHSGQDVSKGDTVSYGAKPIYVITKVDSETSFEVRLLTRRERISRTLKHAAAYLNARLRLDSHHAASAVARAVSVDPWREIELDDLKTWAAAAAALSIIVFLVTL